MSTDAAPAGSGLLGKTHYRILLLTGLGHFLNDATQSLLVPVYPLFRDTFSLSFTQVGLITLTYQMTASFLQPAVGWYTDARPLPFSLPAGMISSLCGLLLLSFASSYELLLLGASLLGIGSSVFHPEASRMARLASGGRFGLAQSLFQVGGNAGSASGPLLAAAVIIPCGQQSISWFSVLPLAGICVLCVVSLWARKETRLRPVPAAPRAAPFPRRVVIRTLAVLAVLLFSKYFYIVSITSYLIFYLVSTFAVSVQSAQLTLFVFLAAVAAGTLVGGPVGDRIGRKLVIWISLFGIAPFTLALPYANLFWTTVFIFIIGFILASAFPSMVVFAQELMPGHVGAVAGLFFGMSFGMGGIGAAVLGRVADIYGIATVYHICSFLPLLGLTALFLPNIKEKREAR